MIEKTHFGTLAKLCTIGTFAFGTLSHGALLIYEGFDGYSGPTLSGQSPNNNTVGLNVTVPLAGGDGASGSGPAQYAVTGGLSLGSGGTQLRTAGGAVVTNADTGSAVWSARSTASSTAGDTIYLSYLVNFTSRGGASGDGLEVRVANNDSTGSARFRVFADSRNNSALPAVDYIIPTSGNNIANAHVGSITPVVGTTYLMLGIFTNTGNALDTTSPGIGTLYAFSSIQFDYMMSQTDPEAWLSGIASDLASNIGSAAGQVSAYATETVTSGTAPVLSTTSRLQITNVKDVAVLDEIRLGTDFSSVVPIIPEPSSVLLVTVGALGLLSRRPRKS